MQKSFEILPIKISIVWLRASARQILLIIPKIHCPHRAQVSINTNKKIPKRRWTSLKTTSTLTLVSRKSTKGPVTRCNFSCNLQCNSTLGRCKIRKYMFPSQFAHIFLTYQTFFTNLRLLRVELRCKLQEKLHRVTKA